MSVKFLIFSFIPIMAFAETQLDKDLLELGIVDSSYKIINYKSYDELLRMGTQQVAPMFPTRVDSVTVALSMNFNRFGMYTNYQIDTIETKDDAEYIMKNQRLEDYYRNYICSLDFSKSLTFRRNGNMAANMSILNSERQVVYHLRVPFKECI